MSKSLNMRGAKLLSATSFLLFCFSDQALATDRTFCVATVAEFSNAMSYWAGSSDDNVIIELVRNTYGLSITSGNFDQFESGGSAALVLKGGYTQSGSNCVLGTINGASTIIDGGANTDLFIVGNGNITIQGLTIQRMAANNNPNGNSTAAVQINSSNNGVLIEDVIVQGNYALNVADTTAVAIGGPSGVVIANSLFYGNSCNGNTVGCSTLRLFYNGMSAELINTTIASNQTFGIEVANGTKLTAVNDILWNNADGDILVDSKGSLNISYSDYDTINNSGSFSTGSEVFHSDPLLNSDYTLKSSPTLSPAINTGAPKAAIALLSGYTYPATDLAGGQRIVGSRSDLGPYESSYDDLHNLVVTNTADTGSGSLRDAIAVANQNPGPAHIGFNIAGGCGQVIVLASPLPDTSYPLSIDGTTQPGWIANTAFGSFNGKACITLVSLSGPAFALEAASDASQLSVSGVGFAGFSDAAIRLTGGSGHVISGNVLTGGSFLPVNNDGIRITGTAKNVLIGGYDNTSTNLIVNGTGAGIHVDNAAGGNVIAYNVIGMAIDGVTPSGNQEGIAIFDSPGNILQYNFIGNSTGAGITLAGSTSSANIVQYNLVGQSYAGGSEPNQVAGVLIQLGASNNSIGGLSASDTVGGNLISNNDGPGVWVSSSGAYGNSVLANELINNGGLSFGNGLPMDLGALGPDANTLPSGTTGPNDMQNFPILKYSVSGPTSQVVGGTLDAAPNREYRLDFYVSSSAPSGYPGRGNAGYFYGASIVTTDGTGHCDFSSAVSSTVFAPSTGTWFSATATSLAGVFSVPQNTSEIGNAVLAISDEIYKNGFEN
jgi:trimeric autotransporter adhesin